MSMSLIPVLVVVAVISMIGSARRGYRYSRWYRDSRLDERRLAELEAALASRDEEMDRLHERVAELESRLDFTERLLARPGESKE